MLRLLRAYPLSRSAMTDTSPLHPAFIDRILTSCFPGQVAKRFAFVDGEVAAVYTLSRKVPADLAQPVILVVATFPPTLAQPGVHDFGIDYAELPVASAQEAQNLLGQFDEMQAALFRAKCRAARSY
jgi:hypothetical protein